MNASQVRIWVRLAVRDQIQKLKNVHERLKVVEEENVVLRDRVDILETKAAAAKVALLDHEARIADLEGGT